MGWRDDSILGCVTVPGFFKAAFGSYLGVASMCDGTMWVCVGKLALPPGLGVGGFKVGSGFTGFRGNKGFFVGDICIDVADGFTGFDVSAIGFRGGRMDSTGFPIGDLGTGFGK